MTPEEEQFMRARVAQILGTQNQATTPPMVDAYAQANRDFAPEERKIARQMALANQLRNTQVPRGRTVGPSNIYVSNPWEGLEAGANAALGGYLHGRANEMSEGLDAERRAAEQAQAQIQATQYADQREDAARKHALAQDRNSIYRDQVESNERLGLARAIGAANKPEPRTDDQRNLETFQRLQDEDPEMAQMFGEAAGLLPKTSNKLSAVVEKSLVDANTAAVDAFGKARSFETLANDIEGADGYKGGLLGTWERWARKHTGKEDYVQLLKTQWMGVRASNAVNNLPPGVASDKDVELALSGFPPEDASADFVASFLRGMAKIEQNAGRFNEFRARHISKRGNERGFLDEWNMSLMPDDWDEEKKRRALEARHKR